MLALQHLTNAQVNCVRTASAPHQHTQIRPSLSLRSCLCFSAFGPTPFQADIPWPHPVLRPRSRILNSTSHTVSQSVTRVRAKSAFSDVVRTSAERRGAKTIGSSTSVTPRASDPSTLRSPIIKWLQEIAQMMITALCVTGKNGPFACDDEK